MTVREQPLQIRRVHLIGFWLCVGLVAVAQSYVAYIVEGRPAPPLARTILWQLSPWLFWAFATNSVLRLVDRFPLDRTWARSIPIHILAATLLTVIQSVLYLGTSYGTEVVPLWLGPGSFFARLVVSRLLSGYFIYASIVAVGTALVSARRLQDRERQLVAARLEALRAQLQPHFLFNALNTTAVLVRETGSRDALRIIHNLADLLRAVLDDSAPDKVTLADEIDLLQRYLDVESIRFADRLRVDIDVGGDARNAVFPRLLLQPVVENAIRHGIAHLRDTGQLRISAYVNGGNRLHVEVYNDGPPLGSGSGIGLRNVRERLETLYPNDHDFALTNTEHGVRAILELPYHAADSHTHR